MTTGKTNKQGHSRRRGRRDPYGPQGRKLPDRIRLEREREGQYPPPTPEKELEIENLRILNAATIAAGKRSETSIPRGDHIGSHGKGRASIPSDVSGDSKKGFSKQASKALEPITHVADATYTEISDNHGTAMFHADQTDVGPGGNPSNSAPHPLNGGSAGTSANDAEIADWLDRLEDSKSSKHKDDGFSDFASQVGVATGPSGDGDFDDFDDFASQAGVATRPRDDDDFDDFDDFASQAGAATGNTAGSKPRVDPSP